MGRPKSGKERYNFLLDKGIYQEFSHICDERGLIRSKQVELALRQFLEVNTGKNTEEKPTKHATKH